MPLEVPFSSSIVLAVLAVVVTVVVVVVVDIVYVVVSRGRPLSLPSPNPLVGKSACGETQSVLCTQR